MDNKDCTPDGGVGVGAGASDGGNKRTPPTPSDQRAHQKQQQKQQQIQHMERLLQLKQQLQYQDLQLQHLSPPPPPPSQQQQQQQQQLLRQQQVEEFLMQHQLQRQRSPHQQQQFQLPPQHHLQRLQQIQLEPPAHTDRLQQLLHYQAHHRGGENGRLHNGGQPTQQRSPRFSAEVEAAGKTASAVAYNSAALSSKLQHQFAQQQQLQQQQQQQHQLQHQHQPLLLLQPSNSSSSSSSPTCVVKDSMTSAAETLANAEARFNSKTAMIAELMNAEAADRSDSGLGSSRTLNSGDERSGSHSSAFSGSADEMHANALSPINDQHAAAPPSAFNAVWRDPNMIQSMDGGPIRHVESVQHRTLFMSNAAAQVPQMVTCQSSNPPSRMMGAGGETLWKSPTAVAANNNGNPPTSNFYQHPNSQPRLNRINTEKEIKKSMMPSIPYTLGLTVENISNAYAKKETDQFLNRHRELNKKHTTEAAVHHHFEESFKARHQKRTNWISNLPVPQGVPPRTHDLFKQKPPTMPTTNKKVVEEWKEKNNKMYTPPVLTPIGPAFSRPLNQQANYSRPHVVPKLCYDHDGSLLNVNKNNGNHHNNSIQQHHPYANSNDCTFSAASSSVIVRNDASYNKDPSTAVPAQLQEPAPPYGDRGNVAVLSVAAVKTDGHAPTKQAKTLTAYYATPLSVMTNSSQPKTHHETPQDHRRPCSGPFDPFPSGGRPRSTDRPTGASSASPDKSGPDVSPPPAHLNPVVGHVQQVLPKIAPFSTAQSDDLFQSEPLDLAVGACGGNRRGTDRETGEYYAAAAERPNDLETSLPDNTVGQSPIVATAVAVTTSVAAATAAGSPKIGSDVVPPASSADTTLRQILSRSLTDTATTTTTTSALKSSPSTPPPVLVPGPYTDVSCGIKTHHHKLKKAWLQRHEWAEDLKEAACNPSRAADDAPPPPPPPPVLECEVAKKRKISKSASENSVHLKISSDLSPSDSDAEPQLQAVKKSKKRKVSYDTVPSENKSATESDKDSDLAAEKKVPPIKIPKKRGRKPKVVVSIPFKKGRNNNDEETRFFQSGPCLDVGPKIHKCRECRIFMNKKKKEDTTQDEIDNIFCRFYAFRRFFNNKNGMLMNAGFPDPYRDVTVEDLNLWMPNSKFPPTTLDVDVSKKVLLEAGRQFCYLVKEENKALNLSPFSKDKPIAWKKAANGVREMCDVCLTTIFNYHWACAKCGFGVCIDCVKARLNGSAEAPNAATMTKKDLRERDTFMWMTCNNKHNHDVERLMLTQIVAGDSMNIVFSNLHQVSTKWNIKLECGCPDHPFPKISRDEVDDNDDSDSESHSKTLEDISNASQCKDSSAESVEPHHNTENPTGQKENVKPNQPKCDTLKHFIRKKTQYSKTIPRQQLPPRAMTLAESQELFPGNRHSWLCDGRLLRLLDPEDPTNCAIFQEQWKRGQPVMISDVGKNLNPDLWSPSSFCRDFGRYTNDLIDCASGLLIEGKTMKQFWDGFEDESKRLTDSDGNKMLLKLKDWPVAADFSETLPERFDDLMRALPLKDYTQREGKLNLASRLPTCFVRPDLGPKMYSAYGNAGYRDPGKQLLSTTNLHLDVSDAVNVMVFVSITHNNVDKESEPNHDWYIKEAYRAVDEAGCDMASRRRARETKECPGAVWHIYQASDADSIRDLLNKISAERGELLEPNHDPIHDQSSYLDANLRARLYNEYGVQGYAVLQCLGDAIFIPAGAPHQVRNLHNCIKVAEDFVSPENLSQCFRLMNEFRDLSSSHINHEDKLQIKNIMYHAVKDSLSVLLHNPEDGPR